MWQGQNKCDFFFFFIVKPVVTFKRTESHGESLGHIQIRTAAIQLVFLRRPGKLHFFLKQV